MSAWLRIFLILTMALMAQPASASEFTSYCPEGVEIPNSAVKNVDNIFRIRAQHPGKQINFSGIALANADFSGRDISKMCFHHSYFKNSNWTGATGNDVKFHRTDLTSSRWNRFRGRDLKFSSSNLNGARLTYSAMPKVIFENMSMENVDASNADLSGGSFRGVSLSSLKQAQFDFANMTGFEFHCGIGQEDNCGEYNTKVSLVGANLTNAAILMAYQSDWNLNNAILDNTRLHFFQLHWIRKSQIKGPVIVEPTEWTPARWGPENNKNYNNSYSNYSLADYLKPVSLSPAELRLVWAAFDRLEKPSFDCDKALSVAEQYICDENRISIYSYNSFADYDRELNQAYALTRRKAPAIIPAQRKWLRVRDACMNLEADQDACISKAYRERIEELWQIVGMEAKIEAGERQFFVDYQTGEFLWEIENSDLRSKMAQMALGNSWAVIIVERNRKGQLMARGWATGVNYHIGDLDSPENGMTFDPVSGYYSGEGFRYGEKPCLPGYALCPIVRLRGHDLETGPQSMSAPETDEYYGNDYISTGVRAHFGSLIAIPLKES